jgi:hypothetical protein
VRLRGILRRFCLAGIRRALKNLHALISSPHRHDGRGAAFDRGKHVVGPGGQRGALLFFLSCPVINPGHARLVAADVVQDRLDDVRRYAELGHSCGDAAAQVVQRPGRELCVEGGVEQVLATRPRREGLGAEDEFGPRRLLHLLSPKGKLVTYGVVSGKPMELPGSLLIWNLLSVEGFYEGHPHILPKIAPLLRELVTMIGPGGIRQPIAAIYPIDQVKAAVAHAVKGGRILLSLNDE